MDSELRELYQQVILDHYRRPRNCGELADANRRADGFNPLCGDRIRVELRINDDGETVSEIAFTGEGCAICTASASMMTESLKGLSLEEARRLFDGFHDLLTGTDDPDSLGERLGKLAIFAGVREFPVRVKCATLPWHTFHAALDKKTATTTE